MNVLSKMSILAAVSAAGLAGLTTAALAEWPEKQVEILVHSGAGSSTDTMARTLANALKEVTDQEIVVTVRGRDALPVLLRSEPDGYTLSTHTRSLLGDIASGKASTSLDELVWVERLLGETYIFAVQADSPHQTAEDLFAAAKADPTSLSMATYRTNSTHQLSALELNKAADADFTIVPYDSGSETVVALLGGNVDAVATNPSNVLQHIEAGTLRGLVVMASERLPLLPDVPTASELGLGVVSYHWRGLVADADVPQGTIAEINAAIDRAIETDVWQEYIVSTGLDNLAVGSAEADASAKAELSMVRDLLAEVGN